MTLALLAPMSHELTPLVAMLGLTPVAGADDDRHAGNLDGTDVVAVATGPRDGLVDGAVFALTQPDGSADPEALRRYLREDPTAADRLTRLAHDMEIATTAAATVAIEACRAWTVRTTE